MFCLGIIEFILRRNKSINMVGIPSKIASMWKLYEKLVSLGAPKIILENEAQRLAEEMVLYYCMAK